MTHAVLPEKLRDLADSDFWTWPDDAKDTLLQSLGDSEVATRRAAVALVYQVVDDAVADKLLALVDEDSDVEVMAGAAAALGPSLELCDLDGYEAEGVGEFLEQVMGEYRPPLSQTMFNRIIKRLERLYHDAAKPKLVRRRALEAAVRAPRLWQTNAVRAAARSGDNEWQCTAMFCMGYVGDFDDSIMTALQRDGSAIQLEAIRAAGVRQLEAAGPIVLRLAAGNASQNARLAAIEALHHLQPPGSEELLRRLATGSDELAAAAQEALQERELFAEFDQTNPLPALVRGAGNRDAESDDIA